MDIKILLFTYFVIIEIFILIEICLKLHCQILNIKKSENRDTLQKKVKISAIIVNTMQAVVAKK